MRVGIAPLFQNYTDFDRFEAMQRGEETPRPDESDAAVMREQLALGEMAEPLGFDSLWTFEHRASPYILLPNPQQFMAYFAGRTKRIDFGSMVTVMPWHHPVRLAENVSLLQHMIGPERRIILGLGRGLARREYETLAIDQNESRELFSEGIEIARRAFRDEQVDFEGEVYKLPRTVVRPRPLDTSPFDDAYGVWTSEASMEVAAQLGLSPLTIPSKSLEEFRRDIEHYDDLRAGAGYGPASAPVIQIFLYCCESAQEAHEGADKFFPEYADSVVRSYELGGDHFKKLKNYDSYVPGRDSIFADKGQEMRTSAANNISKLLVSEGIVGTPDECLEKLASVNDMMSPHEVVLVCSAGTMTYEQARSSVQLFADQVLARAHDLPGPRAQATTAVS